MTTTELIELFENKLIAYKRKHAKAVKYGGDGKNQVGRIQAIKWAIKTLKEDK